MKVLSLHPGFIMPTKGTDQAGAFDIYMPSSGLADGFPQLFGLGFAAAVPENHVALILPRSSIGAKFGLELNNTCGVIDADYRGEWKAMIRTKDGTDYTWIAGERLLQFLVVPIANVTLEQCNELPISARGIGGFGSTGR